MDDKANQGVTRMWPSFETASILYDWANVFLIGALIVGVISTVLIVWMGNTKESYLRRELENTRERTASLELQAEQLRKIAGPRGINQEAFLSALNGHPKLPVQIWYLPDIPDGVWLANQLVAALITAHWDIVEPPVPISEEHTNSHDKFSRFIPPLMRLGAQPSGVSVIVRGVPADIDKPHPELSALVMAIANGLGASAAGGFNESMPKGILRVIIAAKPDPILPPPDSAKTGDTRKK